MKNIIERNLPLDTKYTLVDKKYIPLIESYGHTCDNCNKLIANIATVKNEEGKSFNIGFDCLETVLINNSLLSTNDVKEYERVKAMIPKIIRFSKNIKELIVSNKGIDGLLFERPKEFMKESFVYYILKEGYKPYNMYVKIKDMDFDFLLETLRNIFPKLDIKEKIDENKQKETVKSISEKFSIPESEAKTALEIENEHRDTLEKVANKEITVNEAIVETIGDHHEEFEDYYDKEKGLPAMEKRLEEEDKVKYFTPKTIPSINTIIDNAWGIAGINDLSKYTDEQILKAWQYSAVSESLRDYRVEPKGYNHSRHHHILPQIANPDNINKIRNELIKRGLDKTNGIDLTEMYNELKNCITPLSYKWVTDGDYSNLVIRTTKDTTLTILQVYKEHSGRLLVFSNWIENTMFMGLSKTQIVEKIKDIIDRGDLLKYKLYDVKSSLLESFCNQKQVERVDEGKSILRINSISTTKEQLIEKIKEADKNKITIFAQVEDEDVEYYKSLGFKLK